MSPGCLGTDRNLFIARSETVSFCVLLDNERDYLRTGSTAEYGVISLGKAIDVIEQLGVDGNAGLNFSWLRHNGHSFEPFGASIAGP